MAVDTSMYSNIKPIQIESPLNQLAQVAQLQQVQNQNRLADLAFGEKQRQIAEQDDIRNALSGANGDLKGAQSALLTKGYYKPAMEIGKAQLEQEKAAREAEASKIKLAKDHFELVGQVAGAAKDQQSYDLGLQLLKQKGVDISTIPAQFDPAYVEQARNQALSAAQQLEQVWKQKGYDLDVAKFGETTRHNKSTEGIQQGQLGVSRERLAFEKGQPKDTYDTERGVLVNPRTGVARPVTGADGVPIGAKDKPLNEGQGKATAFASRMQTADQIINDLIASGTKTPSLLVQAGVPGANLLANPSQQKMEQAQRDFVNAVLRQESGASISPAEFDNARHQYFPQPGDSAAVIQQKAQNRATAINGMKTQAGPGAKTIAAPAVAGVPDDIAALLKKHGGK